MASELFDTRSFSSLLKEPEQNARVFYSIIRPGGEHTRSVNNFVLGIIGINVAVFSAWTYAGPYSKLSKKLQKHATLSWRNIHEGRTYTAITSTFSHQNVVHLFFNMLGLWTFGRVIADSGINLVQTAALVIGSGMAGSTAWLYEHRKMQEISTWLRAGRIDSVHHTTYAALGASGIVMGFVATAACLAPTRPMLLNGIPVRMGLCALLYAGMDMFYLGSLDQIGHSAHLGGFLFGYAYYFATLTQFGGILNLWRNNWRVSSPFGFY